MAGLDHKHRENFEKAAGHDAQPGCLASGLVQLTVFLVRRSNEPSLSGPSPAFLAVVEQLVQQHQVELTLCLGAAPRPSFLKRACTLGYIIK